MTADAELLVPCSGCKCHANQRNKNNSSQRLHSHSTPRGTSLQTRVSFLAGRCEESQLALQTRTRTRTRPRQASLSVIFSLVLCFLSARCFANNNNSPVALAFLNHHPNQRLRTSKACPLLMQWNGRDNGSADPRKQKNIRIPKHVAFICDGNSRWAKARGLPSSAGHAAGADKLVKILDVLKESGVLYCTMYAFSTENWNRPADEIRELSRIMEESCRRFYDRAMRENVTVRFLGDLDDERIPEGLQSAMKELQADTEKNTAGIDRPFIVCFALNYGGRQDILKATKKLAQAIAENELAADEVDEELFSFFLSTSNIPDPDVIIRTSGESRLSNFLLWNAAYSELYFTDELWPDFNQKSWHDALAWYSQRQRRFGSRKEIAGASIQNNGATATQHET